MLSRLSRVSIAGLLLGAVVGTASGQAPAEAARWGTLKGRVVFRGKPPGRNLLFHRGEVPPGRDGALILGGEPLFDEWWVVDSKSRGVKNVLVYLPGPTAVRDSAREAAMKAVPTFVLASGRFDPHVLVVMAGSKVDVRSLDPVSYHISAGSANTSINHVLQPFEARVFPVGAAEKNRIGVRDDLHPWMRAYWYVADNPYFAVTDAEGRFEIKDVPAGPQTVLVWHEAVGWVSANGSTGEEVAIVGGGATERDFTIEEERLRL